MDTNQVIQLVRSEIQRQQAESRFQLTSTVRHVHNGSDSPLVSYLNLDNIQFEASSVIYGTDANTQGNYGPFYIATASCFIQSMSVSHVTNSSASPTNLFVEILKPGQASGSGVAVKSFDMTTGANLVATSVLIPGDPGAILNAGDRLSLFLAEAPTGLTQVTVTVLLQFNTTNNV